MRRGVLLTVVVAACVGGASAYAALPTAAPSPLPRPSFSPLPVAPDEDAAAQARARAVDARIERAEAALAAERARAARIEAALSVQRTRLGEQQGPVARLLGALAALARRPALSAIVTPTSTDDLVHVRAVLDGVLPAIRRRTAALRDDVARTRALQASAVAATASLADGTERLAAARRELADLRGASYVAVDPAANADRALAIGEETRDLLDQLTAIGDQQARLADLIRLPGPPPVGVSLRLERAPYRLPVPGRVATGFGEVSRNGVRARGITLAVAPAAAVVAPAAGRVVYARRYRSYGGVVIIDHGAGWNSLIFGLGSIAAREGDTIAAGTALGRASSAPEAQVTVELRRQGRPVDLAQLL